MAKLNARKIVAGLQAEVDEARDVLVNEIVNLDHPVLPPSVMPLVVDYNEKVARLDKALGQ